MLLRSSKKNHNDVSMNDSVGVDKEGNQILLMDILGTDDNDVVESLHRKVQVEKMYENLTKELDDREKNIIKMRYGLNGDEALTQREVAKKMNISRSYVSRIEKKAINKLGKGLKF